MTHKNIFFIINENKLIYFIILKILLIYIIINNFITKNNNETALMINPLNLLNLQLMFNNSIDAYKTIALNKEQLLIMNGNIHNFEGSNLIIDKTYNLLNLSSFFKIDIKINIIKKEILSNLPKVITNKNEIYIYIKSQYFFQKSNNLYIHPPYCFYQNILNNNNISNVKIISEYKNDPVVSKIINEFKNINFIFFNIANFLNLFLFVF